MRLRCTLLATFFLLGSVICGSGTARAAAEWDRRFEAVLAASVDGKLYRSSDLSNTRLELVRMGVEADEAGEVVLVLFRNGISSEIMQRFAATAARVGFVQGISPQSAARRMCEGLTRGYEGVRDLDEQWNFLTAEQVRRIRGLVEKGMWGVARTEAFTALEVRVAGVRL